MVVARMDTDDLLRKSSSHAVRQDLLRRATATTVTTLLVVVRIITLMMMKTTGYLRLSICNQKCPKMSPNGGHGTQKAYAGRGLSSRS